MASSMATSSSSNSTFTYSLPSMVHGYHIYKDIWSAEKGEDLKCVRETSNHFDPFGVAVVKTLLEQSGMCQKNLCPVFTFYQARW